MRTETVQEDDTTWIQQANTSGVHGSDALPPSLPYAGTEIRTRKT